MRLIDKQAIEQKFKKLTFSDLNGLALHIVSSLRCAQFCQKNILANSQYMIALDTLRTHGAILKEYDKMRQQVENLCALSQTSYKASSNMQQKKRNP